VLSSEDEYEDTLLSVKETPLEDEGRKEHKGSSLRNIINGRSFIPAIYLFLQTATQSWSLVRYTKLNPERIFSYMS